jgi:hypothetical protein
MVAAVGSPNFEAVQAWDASWMVMAKRKAKRLMTIDRISMGFANIFYSTEHGIRKLRHCPLGRKWASGIVSVRCGDS